MKTILKLLFWILLFFSCNHKGGSTYLLDEIDKWYYLHESILEKQDSTGTIVNREENEKREMIALKRIVLGLGNEWEFFDQKLRCIDLSNNEYIIKIEETFKNKNQDYTFHHSTYYFDLESNIPVPLTSYTSQVISDKSSDKEKRLFWNGDFSSYMKYHFDLEMKK